MQIKRLSHLGAGFWETLHNIGWTSAARITKMGGSLVVGTLVVRYLGPSRYGTFSYALAIYGLFNSISSLGLDYLVVSDIALSTERSAEEQILGTSLLLKMGASVVTTLAAILYTWFTHPADTAILWIVAIVSAASIFQAFDVVDYFFQAKTRSKVIVLPQLLIFTTSNLARLGAVFLKGPLLAFGIIYALEIFATEMAYALVYWIHQRNLFEWTYHKARALALLRASWPLLIASLLVTIYMRTDQVLLGLLSTKVVVGEYSAASRLSEIWYTIPAVICTSVMPRLLRHKASNPASYYSRLQRLYDLMAIISISIALCITLLGKYCILLLFGAAYLSSAHILTVLAWTGPFVFLGVGSSMQLIHEGLTRISLQRSIAGAICNVGLNLLLIPHFGGAGSAIATLITQFVAAYLMDASNKKTRHIFIMKTKAFSCMWIFARVPKTIQVGAGS